MLYFGVFKTFPKNLPFWKGSYKQQKDKNKGEITPSSVEQIYHDFHF